MMKLKLFSGLFCVLFVLAGQSVQAARIKIWPVKVTLWPEHATESIRLTNEEETSVNVQISATSWDIDESGKFIETDTGDFVFFPRLLTLPPYEEKVVRVGYQGDFPPLEKPYRLLIQELPPVRTPQQEQAGAKKSLGLTYVLKLSVPLFVMPDKKPPAPEIAADGVRHTEKGLKIGLKALGSHHVQVNKLEVQLLDSTGASLTSGENKTHLLRILPHRRVFVEVPLNTAFCVKAKNLLVKVYAEGLNAPYTQRISLAGGRCRAAK